MSILNRLNLDLHKKRSLKKEKLMDKPLSGKLMEYEDYIKMVSILKTARKYIEMAHDDAETRHDSYGDFYMDGGLYEIMEESEKLLSEIDKVVAQFETT